MGPGPYIAGTLLVRDRSSEPRALHTELPNLELCIICGGLLGSRPISLSELVIILFHKSLPNPCSQDFEGGCSCGAKVRLRGPKLPQEIELAAPQPSPPRPAPRHVAYCSASIYLDLTDPNPADRLSSFLPLLPGLKLLLSSQADFTSLPPKTWSPSKRFCWGPSSQPRPNSDAIGSESSIQHLKLSRGAPQEPPLAPPRPARGSTGNGCSRRESWKCCTNFCTSSRGCSCITDFLYRFHA